ncbi:hypothetical protein V1512DRAFT_255949 [Lipomyces arxii]|uniref:uncharacterized protein n=1 Tax=Lipomyces arxii TaxID=56418 RepID=UPI0034CDB831
MKNRERIESELEFHRKRVRELEDELEEEYARDVVQLSSLVNSEYEQYGRQMLVSEIGLPGQLALKNTKVLVVGAGGLGCPALLYLAGAGIGALGVVDHDVVSVSNLHRQILYSRSSVGLPKATEAVRILRNVNPRVQYKAYNTRLDPQQVFEIMRGYDLVLDCTDTPMSRYLIGDASKILQKRLVSASALRTEAQLVSLNVGTDGPCYRCLNPNPPAHVAACSDAGIVGPVVGVAGILQALEAIKIITGHLPDHPTMTIFSAFGHKAWRTVRIRGRQSNCATCGDYPTINEKSIVSGLYNYAEFCDVSETYPSISTEHTISARHVAEIHDSSRVLLDVRDPTQFGIGHIHGAINIPLSDILGGHDEKLNDVVTNAENRPVFVMCRLGNDSRTATKVLLEKYGYKNVYHVIGGGYSWPHGEASGFPRY